jgi:hypothetical protein
LRPIAFTALFSQTLRQTNKGKGHNPNDPHLDQAFPPFAKFSASFIMKPRNTLKRESQLRQIINYSNSKKILKGYRTISSEIQKTLKITYQFLIITPKRRPLSRASMALERALEGAVVQMLDEAQSHIDDAPIWR